MNHLIAILTTLLLVINGQIGMDKLAPQENFSFDPDMNYGLDLFASGDLIYYHYSDDEVDVFTYLGDKTDLTIPATLGGYPVAALGYSALSGLPLERVVLPEGMYFIATSSFMQCEALEEVVLPDSLTVIDEKAFALCSSLQSIELPTGLEEIHYSAFIESGLQSVTLPEGLQYLGSGAFSLCNALTSVSFPSSEFVIDGNPFYGNMNLRSFDIAPDHPFLTVEGGALIDKRSATLICMLPDYITPDLRLPEGIKAIDHCAFCDDIWLQNVILPEGITEIGESSFCRCSSLRSISLPHSLTEIKVAAFFSSDSLEDVHLSSGLTTIGDYAFCGCASLKDVTIPASVTSIGALAFGDCPHLTLTVYPDSYAEAYAIDNHYSYKYADE